MIRVDRGRLSLPAGFAQKAMSALRKARRLRRRRLLESGDFDREVYGHREVKKALWRMQHKKCCWCEQRLGCRSEDVDHFRPKTKARRAVKRYDEGYWWLAYKHDNLFFSCAGCNTLKGSWFPLQARARPLQAEEHPSTRHEAALLLDPAKDDPAQHLVFIKDDGAWRLTALNRSRKGRTTIQRVQLDRDDLDELRDDWVADELRPVRRRFEQARRQQDLDAARAEALRLCTPERSFSLLARCYFVKHRVLRQADLP
ncbi:hypothetical protein [Archangium sp.]|uniref:hypothetical protein n=1 Tax=Archangium sp. TaxID=1872627 RepID=UPI00286C5EA2|nr:hypothetical protein [Archangium sp.]